MTPERSLLILGAGQYGQLVRDVAVDMGIYSQIAFLDDHAPGAVGKLEDCAAFAGEYTDAFVAMGNSQLRLAYLDKLEAAGFTLPVLRHPGAVVLPSAQVEKGTVLEPMVVVSANAWVEKGCILSAGAVVNHNSHIGQGCHIDCGAVVPAGGMVAAGTKVCCGQVFG